MKLCKQLYRGPARRFFASRTHEDNLQQSKQHSYEDKDQQEQKQFSEQSDLFTNSNRTFKQTPREFHKIITIEENFQNFGRETEISEKMAIVKRICSLTHTLYPKNLEIIKNYKYLPQLLTFFTSYLKDQMELLPTKELQLSEAYHLSDILHFYRKFLKYKTTFPQDLQQFQPQLQQTITLIKHLVSENRINAKIAADICYDLAVLEKDTTFLVEYLHFEIQKEKPLYFNKHTLMTIIHSLVLVWPHIKQNRKGQALLEQSASMILPQLAQMTLQQQTLLFKQIAKLSQNTEKTQLQDIMTELILLIEPKKDKLTKEDQSNLIEGYCVSPFTVNQDLLQSIKKGIIKSLKVEPYIYPLPFLLHLNTHLGVTKNDFCFEPFIQGLIADEIMGRLMKQKQVKLLTIVACLEAFKNKLDEVRPLIAFLFSFFINTKKTELSASISSTILIDFQSWELHDQDVLIKMIENSESNLDKRHNDILFKLLDASSHPLVESDEKIQKNNKKLLNIMIERISDNERNETYIFGLLRDKYQQKKSEAFVQLQTLLFNKMKDKLGQMNEHLASKQVLAFSRNSVAGSIWASFLQENYLKKEQTKSLVIAFLHNYKLLANKEQKQFQFVLNILKNMSPKDLELLLKPIFEFVIASPFNSLQNSMGNPEKNLLELIEKLPQKPDFNEQKIPLRQLLLLGKTLKNQNFYPIKLTQYILSFYEQKQISLKHDLPSKLSISHYLCQSLSQPLSTALHYQIKTALNQIFNDIEFDQLRELHLQIRYIRLYMAIIDLKCEKIDDVYINLIWGEAWKTWKQEKNQNLPIFFLFIDLVRFEFKELSSYEKENTLVWFKEAVKQQSIFEWYEGIFEYVHMRKNYQIVQVIPFLALIEQKVISSGAKYPNMISAFWKFFSLNNCKNINVYNRLLSDLQSVYHQVKPAQILEIMDSLAKQRHHHKQLFAQFVEDQINLTDKNVSNMTVQIAETGMLYDFATSFIEKNSIDPSLLKEEQRLNYIWSLCVFDKMDFQVQEFLQNYLNHHESLSFKKSVMVTQIIDYLRFVQQVTLGDDLIQMGEKVRNNNLQGQADFLINYLQDWEIQRKFDNKVYVDAFIPEKNLVFLAYHGIWVCFDEKNLSGFGVLRQKIIKAQMKQNLGVRIEQVFKWDFDNLQTPELKQKYIKSLINN